MNQSIIASALAELYPIIEGKPSAFDVKPISEAEHAQCVAALERILKAVDKWPQEPISKVEEEAVRTIYVDFFEVYEENWQELPEHDWLPTSEEKAEFKREAKKALVEALAGCKEYFDLRLCAAAANEVAVKIGRAGVRVYFQDTSRHREPDYGVCVRGGLRGATQYFAEQKES